MWWTGKRPIRRAILAATVLAGLAVAGLAGALVHEYKWLDTGAVVAMEAALRRLEPISPDDRHALRTYLNPSHLDAARAHGVPSIADEQDIADAIGTGALMRLPSSTLHYRVARLTHSHPVLTPTAANLLDRIAREFQFRVLQAGGPRLKIIVTSILRTEAQQSQLGQVNNNAARESSHTSGVSFDISYSYFLAQPELRALSPIMDRINHRLPLLYRLPGARLAHQYSDELQGLLAEVLRDMQDAGDALVIYEQYQKVFHVTVTR